MYHVCKYIKEKTDVKVVLTGEVADELFGYKYTDFAPDEWEFQKEAQKRIREIYLYDVLRADRSIAAHSLEARVPFSDKDFVRYVMSLHPKLKMNTSGHGKYLLRKAFEDGQYLPEEILWRQKAAFSDAVGHSLSDCLKAFSEVSYTAEEFDLKKKSYSHGTPFTKESLLYREIFEKFFKGQGQLIPDYWMPNKSWKNCDVDDPSARVLPNYGASGV
jgi:asparagine synthase (glutamine-hydrolysing)